MSKTSTDNNSNLPKAQPVDKTKWSTLIHKRDGVVSTMEIGPGAALPPDEYIMGLVPYLNGERNSKELAFILSDLHTEADNKWVTLIMGVAEFGIEAVDAAPDYEATLPDAVIGEILRVIPFKLNGKRNQEAVDEAMNEIRWSTCDDDLEPVNHKWSTLIKQVDGMCWTMDIAPGDPIPEAENIVRIVPFLPNGERDNGTVYNAVLGLTTQAIDDACADYSAVYDDLPADLTYDFTEDMKF